MNIRAQAIKQERLLRSVEALGDNVIRMYAKSFQEKALSAIGGGKLKISQADTDKIVNEMADLMLLGFVKRYRFEKQSVGIRLSFQDDIREIAKGFELDLDRIRGRFVTIAKTKVRQSVGSIESRINDELGKITGKQVTTRDATRMLRRRFDEMGLTPKNPVLAETLVRTHTQIAFAAGQYQLDQDDPDDVIWGYTYVTVGDNRVRDEHAVLDGLTRPKNDPIWDTLTPPNGWNCRCQLIPLTAPTDVTKVPKGVKPDPGFEFNAGQLIAG